MASQSLENSMTDTFDLPPYTRNLLRIKVPVGVTLAHKKQPVQAIVELVPGAIIQFNKSCDEMLELEISGRPAAVGECVKVGDKFGLRITSMMLPDERFAKVSGK
jgi:flagellar motor switch protein FliN